MPSSIVPRVRHTHSRVHLCMSNIQYYCALHIVVSDVPGGNRILDMNIKAEQIALRIAITQIWKNIDL